MQLPPVITIDGPSGSGKSVLSRSLSQYLQWFNLESGIIYRIFACLFLQHNSYFSKIQIMSLFNIFDNYFIYENGKISKIITKNFHNTQIISKEVTNISSKLATLSYVRKYLLHKQRLFRRFPGLITNGRDMGSIVFPDAIIKFFLQADLKNRVQRRLYELNQNGFNYTFQDVLLQIQKRDNRDQTRTNDPLKVPNDAIILDSSNMTCDQILKQALYNIKKHTYLNIFPTL